MFESIFSQTAEEAVITFPGLLLALNVSLVLGVFIAFTYMKTHKGAPPSQSFSLTLVMLPAVVTVIILLVGSNMARAFSLAGAFSIIRFRSAPGDAKDITYVLFSMAVGLAAGMGFMLYAAAVAILLCAAMTALERLQFGVSRETSKILKITVPEDLDFEGAFDSILEKYTNAWKLQRVRTADLGSLYELSYRITTKQDTSGKAFIDELRCRNGNLNITLVLDAPGAEL